MWETYNYSAQSIWEIECKPKPDKFGEIANCRDCDKTDCDYWGEQHEEEMAEWEAQTGEEWIWGYSR